MTATTEKTIADELRTAAVRLRCEHSFPVQPPSGSVFALGPCEHCSVPWRERAPLAEVPERLREPLAALLDQIADDMADKDAIEGTASKAVHPVSDIVGLLAPRADWTAALAFARLMNGGDRG